MNVAHMSQNGTAVAAQFQHTEVSVRERNPIYGAKQPSRYEVSYSHVLGVSGVFQSGKVWLGSVGRGICAWSLIVLNRVFHRDML